MKKKYLRSLCVGITGLVCGALQVTVSNAEPIYIGDFTYVGQYTDNIGE